MLITYNTKCRRKLPRMTAQLISMVITEVLKRLVNKKNMLHEPLEQIILNQYTIIKFQREERREREKKRGKLKK